MVVPVDPFEGGEFDFFETRQGPSIALVLMKTDHGSSSPIWNRFE